MYVVDYKDNNKNDVDDLVGYKVSHHLCIKGFFCLFSLASDVLTPVLRQLVFFTVNMSSTRLWESMAKIIGVRAGGARGAAAPPNFGQRRFFGQREKIWEKSVFKDVTMFIYLFWRPEY